MNEYIYYDDEEDTQYVDDEVEEIPPDTAAAAETNEDVQLGMLLSGDAEKTISGDTVLRILRRDVKEIAGLTLLSEDASLLLLRDSKWLIANAKEAYFLDTARVLAKLKLSGDIARHTNTLVANDAPMECPVCLSDLAPGEALALSSCGHKFCTDCWRDAVQFKVSSNDNVANMRCLESGCQELVGMDAMMSLFERPTDAVVHKKIQRSCLLEYVASSPRLCWCPNAGCESILYVPVVHHHSQTVTCGNCHEQFCFQCGQTPHAPVSCAYKERWTRAVASEGANMSYVMTHTKACPQCHSRIEKNLGCNHMVCKCRYEFCWICMKNWINHNGDFFTCRNANPEPSANEKEEEQAHNRFLFDYERYALHLDSMHKEIRAIDVCSGQKGTAAGVYASTDKQGMSALVPPDVLFRLLQELRVVLRDARMALSAAYIKDFYDYPENTESKLFNHRRGNLEQETEALSQKLEALVLGNPVDSHQLRQSKEAVEKWTLIVVEG